MGLILERRDHEPGIELLGHWLERTEDVIALSEERPEDNLAFTAMPPLVNEIQVKFKFYLEII